MIDDYQKRDETIAKIIAYLNKQLPETQAELITAFIKQYYGNVAYEDLRERSIMDLAGAALCQWNLMYQRRPQTTKVKVYNPQYEQHGWQSTHTIIEISIDDMPFLVDTIRMEITRRSIGIHLVIYAGRMLLRRDAQDRITEVMTWTSETVGTTTESPIHLEINRITDDTVLQDLQQSILAVLADVRVAVDDWPKMIAQVDESLVDLDRHPPDIPRAQLIETKDFLRWLKNNNFIFLGSRDYELVDENGHTSLNIKPTSGLGIHHDISRSKTQRPFSDMPEAVREQYLSHYPLVIAKTNTMATVQRPVYTDYIGIKRFDEHGRMMGERRFVGLFTSAAYNTNPRNIPFLRHKVATVLNASGLLPSGHSGKALLNILETFPRDDLFQADTNELTRMCLGILNLQERDRLRLFAREDIYGRYMSCLVYLPRERYDTNLLRHLQKVLEEAFGGYETTFSTFFSDSVLARIHYIVRIDPKTKPDYDLTKVEAALITAARIWVDDLRQFLIEFYGEEHGIGLFAKYSNAFPAGYHEAYLPRIAVADIKYMEKLSDSNPLVTSIYRPENVGEEYLHLKFFRLTEPLLLSDVMPLLENLGLSVHSEHPYEITRNDGSHIWIHDFGMRLHSGRKINLTLVKKLIKEAFLQTWLGNAENDAFNSLVILANLDWREAVLLRAYAKYMRQITFSLSQSYIESTLAHYPELTRYIIDLFNLRFNPLETSKEDNQQAQIELQNKLELGFDSIDNLNEDRIFRFYLTLIKATLRTNYFQTAENGEPKSYVSFKFAPEQITELPLPKPRYEIFVYSPNFEAIHLRSAKVARGGLRWSDRREDFRTEVLGLMKAQRVKNAVIVPEGAKGGFVLKRMPKTEDRSVIMQTGIACYKDFIRGMLDITDNLVDNHIVSPRQVVRHDNDDPYLVVAADKGTATFSDIANEVVKEYDFWLGDAFASGGSNGYDHKKIGITARGGWESVKRHFRSIGKNIQHKDFTVTGIGDMSGDVFGNGMLLSEHICLVAAFNHEHIFIDPTPNAKASFKERQRLFSLPRSSWSDYNEELISQGGGIFNRRLKSIAVTPQMKSLLNITADKVQPDELISYILKAEVDLLWNGGIGTYVKASYQTNFEVGDKTNDNLRIDGDELRCKMVGEGGNLGFTQAGRIEYALNGGAIYTDFIDNSAGVDCSDHEVNLKILLNKVVENKKITEAQRNKLLAKLTDEIAELVLKDNHDQTEAIEAGKAQSIRQFDLFRNYINYLEQQGILNRELENIPDEKTLIERKANGIGLTYPEIAVLLAYTKLTLKQSLINTNIFDEPCLIEYLSAAFPKEITQKYSEEMLTHRLANEIIVTQLCNEIVNEMGCIFVYRLRDETGATTVDVVRAYLAAKTIFRLPQVVKEIENLDTKIPVNVQMDMFINVTRLIRRAVRWILRNYRGRINTAQLSSRFAEKIVDLFHHVPMLLQGLRKEQYEMTLQHYIEVGTPQATASLLATSSAMYSALDILEAALSSDVSVKELAAYYFVIGNELNLNWLRKQITEQIAQTSWETLSLAAFSDDLDYLQRVLAVSILKFAGDEEEHPSDRVQAWAGHHRNLVERWKSMEATIRANQNISIVELFVALRELMDLAQAASAL